MVLPAPLQSLVNWIQTETQLPIELVGMLLGAAFLLGLIILLRLVRIIVRWASLAGSTMSAGAKGRKAQPGYQILVSPPAGTGRSAFKFLVDACEEHLSSFSFDAPLHVSRTARIVGGRDAKSERSARKRLKRADADMIVWGERAGRGNEGLNVFTLSRAGGLTSDEAVLQHFALPSASRKRSDAIQRLAAYLLAKRLQPSLGRPADFRAERLEPVARQLETLLEAGRELAPRVRNEIEHDFSAAALHVGESGAEGVWLDKVIELRRATLERLGNTPQAGIWAAAKLDLGRAMIAKASRSFDPAIVSEGSHHLREAIEILKADPSIRRAEDAMRTLDSARNLTANRDRFSINFNG